MDSSYSFRKEEATSGQMDLLNFVYRMGHTTTKTMSIKERFRTFMSSLFITDYYTLVNMQD
jgi:hypothetical protein